MLTASRKPNLKVDSVANPLPCGFVKPTANENEPKPLPPKTNQAEFHSGRQDKKQILTSSTLVNTLPSQQQILSTQNTEKPTLLPGSSSQNTHPCSMQVSKSSKALLKLHRQPLRQSYNHQNILTQRKNRRSIDEFLKSQVLHSRRSAQRLQNVCIIIYPKIKKEVEQNNKANMTFRPKITKYPVPDGKLQVHDRLYSKGPEYKNGVYYRHIELNKQDEVHQKEEEVFQYSTSNLTMNFASMTISRPFTHTLSKSDLLSCEKNTKHNNKLLVRKFIKEVKQSCQRLGISQAILSQQTFINIMADMNFCGNNTERLKQLYSSLQQVSLKTSIQIICSIFGIHDMELVHSMMSESDFGLFISQQGSLSQQQSRQIKSKYDCLHLWRLNRDRLSKNSRELISYLSQKDLTFKPQISKKSRQLAQKYKQKRKNVTTDKPNYQKDKESDSRSISVTASAAKLQFNHLTDREKEDTIPQRTERPTNKQSARKSDMGMLHQVGRRRFKQNWKPFAGNIEKEIVRLIYARKKRSGIIKPEPTKDCCGGEERQPLIKLDIFIDDEQKHQLVVNNEDEPEQIARRFSSQFHISNEARQRLSDLIISQIHKVK